MIQSKQEVSPYQQGFQLRINMETAYISDKYPYHSGSPESVEFWQGWRDADEYCNCVPPVPLEAKK